MSSPADGASHESKQNKHQSDDQQDDLIGSECPFGGEPSADIKSRVYTAEGDTLE
jgi:hypothetical protein